MAKAGAGTKGRSANGRRAKVGTGKAGTGKAGTGKAGMGKSSAPQVHDMAGIAWQEAGKPGLYLKPVRSDREAGHFLGLVRIDEGVRTGLHQHLDVASSYVLKGALTDYAGTLRRGQAGINVNGDTHDAIAYEDCVLASRLDGPTLYAPDPGTDHELHVGARKASFNRVDAARQPDLNITVADLRPIPGFVPGMVQRMVFDYAGTGHDRRMVCLQLQPGTQWPMHRTGGLVDWYVVAGDIAVNGRPVTANSFVVQEAGLEVGAVSAYGCMLLAWAEGPVEWLDGSVRPDPYGFPPR